LLFLPVAGSNDTAAITFRGVPPGTLSQATARVALLKARGFPDAATA
jgi:hypothetical protein